jgi:hypothetical protein
LNAAYMQLSGQRRLRQVSHGGRVLEHRIFLFLHGSQLTGCLTFLTLLSSSLLILTWVALNFPEFEGQVE